MIGVFDSGIGGLTVLDAFRQRLPRRDFVYVADSARMPYGPRDPEEIRKYAAEITGVLVDRGAEAVVVACNTASAAALPGLRLASPVPVWGMVDAGVEAATRATRNGRIAVIGTQGTIASGVYQRKLQARGFRVWAQACPALAIAAEERPHEAEVLVRHYLREMPRVDTLLLGCTHFPLVGDVIRRVAGPRVQVVEGSQVLARTVAEQMEDEGQGRVQYLVTGDPVRFQTALKSRPGRPHLVQQCSLAEVRRGVEIVQV
jgi:glutamate racemase